MKKYQFKDSGIEWLGKIPEHWGVTKLKKEFQIMPSNVDKKSKESEDTVKLCNYVDVYYNDFIKLNIDFMIATASEHQIKKFQLQNGDVLITKDSEDPFDIAVPALVKETEDKLLCGYHLSMIRTINNKIHGAFLFWSLMDKAIASQLFREATGVTRWAIASRHIKNSIIAFPPLPEQKAIAAYLDRATAKIDRMIAIKEAQLEKMEGYFLTRVKEVIRFGLGNEELIEVNWMWTTKIPKNWKHKRFKDFFRLSRGVDLPKDKMKEGNYPVLGSNGIIGYHNQYTTKGPGITVGRSGSVGAINFADEDYWAHNTCLYVYQNNGNDWRYLYYFLLGIDLSSLSGGSVVGTLNRNYIHKEYIGMPPFEIQNELSSYLDNLKRKIDSTVTNLQTQIQTLHRYRRSLIHECVTGKQQVAEVT